MFKIIGILTGIIQGSFLLGIGLFFVGSLIDSLINKAKNNESPETLARIQRTFFETTFTLIGYIAKSDGVVAQEEIDQTQALMDKMGLNADHKREAIRLFKHGASPNFEPEEMLANFLSTCGPKPQLVYVLMTYLVNTVLADGTLHPKEDLALRRISKGLHFSHIALEQLLQMLRAQGNFSRSHYYHQHDQENHKQHYEKPSRNQLHDAYAALGVTEASSDTAIKKAYRKLMSDNHPDKLIGQGVPEDMVRLATERSQEIQMAYDLIKKARKS